MCLRLVRLEVTARGSVDEISHREDGNGGKPLSLSPGGHQSIRQDGTDEGDAQADQPGNLQVGLGSGTASELHGETPATDLGLGHASEGKLGDTDQPGESVRVIDKGGESQSDEGKDTPEPDLSLDLGPVGLDDESLRPCGGVPFLLFVLLGGGHGVFQVVSVVSLICCFCLEWLVSDRDVPQTIICRSTNMVEG